MLWFAIRVLPQVTSTDSTMIPIPDYSRVCSYVRQNVGRGGWFHLHTGERSYPRAVEVTDLFPPGRGWTESELSVCCCHLKWGKVGISKNG
jgi:hypothetical protein